MPARKVDGFRRSLALVIGIDHYLPGIPQLKTALSDARSVGSALGADHGFEVELMLDGAATVEQLRQRLRALRLELSTEDRLLIYFAGHGVACDGDDGLQGYLLLHDALHSDLDSFMPMAEFHQEISPLPCRHLLVILDCCFAGAFRWLSVRHAAPPQASLHIERYQWFINDPAWQVITSAAHDQKAFDVVAGETLGARGPDGQQHSPFAAALLDGLAGAADARRGDAPGDGVITATELYLFLRDRLQPPAGSLHASPVPCFWPLPRHDKGEYIFLVPGREPTLAPAPPLLPGANPWRGLLAYGEQDNALFFGRGRATRALLAMVENQPLVVVVGPSGSGKSSLLGAGLLPLLHADPNRLLVGPFRPGMRPLHALAAGLGIAPGAQPTPATLELLVHALLMNSPGKTLCVLIDQFEELVTMALDAQQPQCFTDLLASLLTSCDGHFRIVVTVRSDFEALFAASGLKSVWRAGRYMIPPMTQDELRRVIEEPAVARVLRFDSGELVEHLINEVVHTPGPLPLLSFVLSEMYARLCARHDPERLMRVADHEALEGVAGALQHRASEEYQANDALQPTIRRVLLRMVSVEGGEPARRRVMQIELAYREQEETGRVDAVLRRLVEARLLVSDESDGRAYIEPAHETLIRSWDKLAAWLRNVQAVLPLMRAFWVDALAWQLAGRVKGQLWDEDPRLQQIVALLRTPAIAENLMLNAIESDFLECSLARRRSRRNRRIAGAAAGGAFAIAAIVGLLLLFTQGRERASAAALLDQTANIGALLESPRQFDGLFAAIDAADLSRQIFGKMSAGVRSGFLHALERAREMDRWKDPHAQITDIAVTPGGDAVLVRYRRQDDDVGHVKTVAGVWTLAAPHRWTPVDADPAADTVSVCNSGACLALGFAGRIDVIDLQGALLWRLARTDRIAATAIQSDRQGQILFAGSENGTIQIHPRDANAPTRTLRIGMPVRRLEVSADGALLLAMAPGRAAIVRVADGNSTALKVPPGLDATMLRFSPRGDAVFYDGAPGEIWRLRSDGSKAHLLTRKAPDRTGAMAISADGAILAVSGDTDGAIHLIDTERGRHFASPLLGGNSPVLGFTPDGRKLLEAGYLDNTLKVFDASRDSWRTSRIAVPDQISTLALCNKDHDVIWGGFSGRIGSRPLAGGPAVVRRAHREYVERVVCLAGGAVASVARDGKVLLWDSVAFKTWKWLGPQSISFGNITPVDGGKALLASSGKEIWRLELDGSSRRWLVSGLDDIGTIESDDRTGRVAIGSSGTGYIAVHDAEGRVSVAPFRAHIGLVRAIVFSRWDDGFVSSGTVGDAQLFTISRWDPHGRQLASTVADNAITFGVGIDATTRLTVSAGSDGAVRLWDDRFVRVGPDLLQFNDQALAVAVGTLDSVILAGGSNNAIQAVAIDDAALLTHACGRIQGHGAIVNAAAGTLEYRVRAICGAALRQAAMDMPVSQVANQIFQRAATHASVRHP